MSVESEAPESADPSETRDTAGSIRDPGDALGALLDRLRGSASVSSVYGEPIDRREKTIVPVARVAYGFGGGFGDGADGEGAGAGGGVAARPVGVVEITDDDTRFVRLGDRRRLLAAFGFGLLAGLLLGRRRRGD